ncbi:hypothetical protein KY389_14360 [Paracoccus bogoriensis]|uniref:hypothetical protein n=1 Tax=Paracoccus bogoriensis TaxID=242065 RepID=UPI001CA4C9BC|nr:hypothetical protein [Paracoccus bogoriensis]MBW7057844.1 hypothetical protein [Paracoccus bogoriensis]
MSDLRSLIALMHRARDTERRYGGARLRTSDLGPMLDFTTADDPALRWLEYCAAQAEKVSDPTLQDRKIQWLQGLNRYKEMPFRDPSNEATDGRPGSRSDAPHSVRAEDASDHGAPAEARPEADQTHAKPLTHHARNLR